MVPGLRPFLLPLFTELPRRVLLGNPYPYTRTGIRFRGVRKRAAGVLRRMRQGRLPKEVVRKGDLRKVAGDGKWSAALQLD